MKAGFLQRFKATRKAEEERYDQIIREAEEHDRSVMEAERRKWGHEYEASEASFPSNLSPDESSVAAVRRLAEAGCCASAYPELFDDKAAVRAARKVLSRHDLPDPDALAVLRALDQNHYVNSVKSYLERYPHATVVLVGCGLSTLFFCADNRRAHWVMVDRPETLQMRTQLGLDRHDHIEHLPSTPSSLEWLSLASKSGSKGFAVVVEDDLAQWEPSVVKDMVQRLAKRSGAQLTFNCVGARAAKGRTGFRLFDLNAQSAFRAWLPEPRIRIYESVAVPKGVARELPARLKRDCNSLASHGWRMCMDIKY